MTEILFNEQALLTEVPPLTDRVLIYPQAGFREDSDTDLIAEQKAVANPPQPFTLQNLKALLAPPATTNLAGVMEIATGTEVAAGTDSSKALTPATFQQNTRIDATLAGTGTIGDAWRVANPFTAAEKTKLGNIAARAASAFTGLSDTPSAFTGEGGKFLAVNSGATAVEFVDAPSGGGSGATTFLALSDTPNAYGTGGELLRVGPSGGVEFGPTSFDRLSDTPVSYGTAGQVVAVNSARTGLEFVDAATAGASNFLALSDTPSTFGTAGHFLAINPAGNAITFVNPPNSITGSERTKLAGIETGAQVNVGVEFTQTEKTKLAGIDAGAEINVRADWNATSGDALILNKPTIPSTFVGLTDTPSALTGQGGKHVAVNSGGTALELVDAPSGGGAPVAVQELPAVDSLPLGSLRYLSVDGTLPTGQTRFGWYELRANTLVGQVRFTRLSPLYYLEDASIAIQIEGNAIRGALRPLYLPSGRFTTTPQGRTGAIDFPTTGAVVQVAWPTYFERAPGVTSFFRYWQVDILERFIRDAQGNVPATLYARVYTDDSRGVRREVIIPAGRQILTRQSSTYQFPTAATAGADARVSVYRWQDTVATSVPTATAAPLSFGTNTVIDLYTDSARTTQLAVGPAIVWTPTPQ